MRRRFEKDRAESISILGAVQGVGFRPFVLRTARQAGLRGTVANGPRGVLIHVEGAPDGIESLVCQLTSAAPAAAVVERVERNPSRVRGATDFTIVASESSAHATLAVGPDLALCSDCRDELLDPNNRRSSYPFLSCIGCGPRYTIVESLPYDRSRTTMGAFEMCTACQQEFDDPRDRRFHAQANACAECGPELAFSDVEGALFAGDSQSALGRAVQELAAGRCVAVLGLGGFQLCVRADDDPAISRLRTAKRRGDKAFALMFEDIDALGRCVEIGAKERELLQSPAAPIVLLRRKPEARALLGDQVAPGNAYLGCMLPTTPLHLLLLRRLGRPLVATSGNQRDEPLCTTLEEGLERLHGLADGGFLHHNRPIARGIDDSVVRVVDGEICVLRRARGYAPLALDVSIFPDEGVDLALGGHLKNAVALRSGRRVAFSPHVGDLQTLAARMHLERAVLDLQALTGENHERVVCDEHPDYASTLLAERMSEHPLRVQHHRAHAFAVAAEHGLLGDWAAVTWDGTGYGEAGGDSDGNTIWGGEFFVCGDRSCGLQRVGRLRPFPLPGGEGAVREPWRCAFGLLAAAFGDAVPAVLLAPVRSAREENNGPSEKLMRQALAAAPQTSSMGRLFDCVAVLLGLASVVHYEAEAAIRLERCALDATETESSTQAYRLPRSCSSVAVWQLDHRPLLEDLAKDLEQGVPRERIALRFHRSLVNSIVAFARHSGKLDVTLSGGCFQNFLLLGATIGALRAAGFRPHWPQQLPSGDGGLALGQLASVLTTH